MAPLWNLTALVPIERRMRLLELRAFKDVIYEIVATSDVLNYEAEPFKDSRLKGCTRASFLLSVANHVYDGFFNSPIGYRAQYCLGRDKGDLANRQVIDALKPKLLAFAESAPTAALGLKQIRASLDSPDAKIWIDENEPISPPSNDFQIEIDYGPWVERAKRADAFQEDEFIGAIRGVLAPFGTRLEVKGGWLDDRGLERNDPGKSQRSEEIAVNGFS